MQPHSALSAALIRTALLLGLRTAAGDEFSHRYTDGETVNLWVNKVGPYHNPQETYVYYSLPFCSTKPVADLEHRWDYLGEVLEGNDLISSGLAIQFGKAVHDHSKICSMTLSEASVQQLQYAVRNHYWHAAALPPEHSTSSQLSRLSPCQVLEHFNIDQILNQR